MTDEEFVAMFGCDRDTYDRILWENECRILNNAEEPNGSEVLGVFGGMCKAHEAKLRERENRYNEILAMEKEDVNVLHICSSKN